MNASYIFYYSRLKALVIPSGVTTLGSNALSQLTSMKRISIPKTLTTVGASSFASMYAIDKICLPKETAWNQNSLFSQCYTMREVYIGKEYSTAVAGATSIFNSSPCITKIKIPKGLSSIGAQMFSGATALRIIDFSDYATVPALDNVNAFTNITNNTIIVVPDNLYNTWIATSPWDTITPVITKASQI